MHTVEDKPNRQRRRRPKLRRKIGRWNWIAEALLAVVVVGSVLAIGSVHVPALLAVSALALIGATAEAFSLRRVPWPAVALAALGSFSALQAIPLPAAWVHRLSPISADVWVRCLAPFAEPALRRFSLSLDAGASIAEALKWLTYACVYVMAARMRARRGSVWLAALLFGTAVLVTLITLLHGVANLRDLYGVYHPTVSAGRWNLGPLLNSNNLAGYAILGLFCGGGLLLSDRSPFPRLPVAIGQGIICVALCLSGSRAAVLSVIVFGVGSLAWLARGRGARFSGSGVALGLAPIVVGIGIAIAVGTSRDAGALASLDVQRKVLVWVWSLPMIREHALFGVGRGAFETAFPPYREALGYDWSIVVTHAENFIIQWVAEWGAPVGACAVVLILGYVLREWYRSRRDPQRFLILTGLVALFIQNLADLGLEVPALAIAAVLALAAGERPTAAPASDAAKPLGWLAMGLAAPACLLWAATLTWSRFPVELQRREMSAAYRELAVTSPKGRAQFRISLRQAILRHPGEPFFPLLGSLVEMRQHQGNALPWIARALELGPTSGTVHLALAELLQAHGSTTQAMLHLRLAAQYDRTLAGAVSKRAPVWAPSVDVLMQAIPEGPYGEGMLLDACGLERRIDLKIECFRRAVLSSPRSPQAQLQWAEALLGAIRSHGPPCASPALEPCAAEAEAAIQSAETLDPKSWRPGYLMSQLLLARGDTLAAARLLVRECPPDAEGDECWHEALIVALKSGSTEAIGLAAEACAARPCEGMEACANKFSSLASSLDAGGQAALASTFFTKAAEADPTAERWLKVAEHATEAHLYGVAGGALDRADRSPDATIASRAHAEVLRQRVAGAASAPL